LNKGCFDVCFLLETKKTSLDDHLIQNLWGHKDVRWVVKDLVGLSGDLLVMWNSDSFNLVNSFSGESYLGITVEREGAVTHLVNIYSPCSLSGKKKLWEDLLEIKQLFTGGKCCLRGDFNAILHSSERKGASVDSRQGERMMFNRFVEEMEMIDVPVLGKKVSWVSADGKSMSRLDRFILSDGFITKFGIIGQWIGNRNIFDHCPIWLYASAKNWDPKPFRAINGCLEHPDFLVFLESCWKSFDILGTKAYVLKEKLRFLKEILKKWNKEVFGILDLNIDKTVKELNDIEKCWVMMIRR
jgi:hypothetical protein